MSATSHAAALAQSAAQREAAEKHNRLLLQAAQVAHPVIYQGQQRFIQVMRFDIAGGMDVYLTGDPTPLRPEDVQLAPKLV